MKILGGDIGGTNTRLALFEYRDGQLSSLLQQTYPSHGARQFSDILAQFLTICKDSIDACCLGVAGPVVSGRCEVTNLPWVLDAEALLQQFPLGSVSLINDLVANAYGISAIPEADLLTLVEGEEKPAANRAVISAGTGLGEAGLVWDGRHYIPFATEGGHCDFGPANRRQMDLLTYLQPRLGHVSYEKILSGSGLEQIYDFTHASQNTLPSADMLKRFQRQGKAATISSFAINKQCGTCEQALDLFLEIYGQEASNLALKTLALGGIFLGGGIAARLAGSIATSGAFLRGFKNKGAMTRLVDSIPVKLILNPDTALLGAALCAAEQPH